MSDFTEAELQYMQAHINDTRVPDLYWIYSSAIVIAVTSTALRVIAKRYTRNGVSLDDLFAVIATLFICGDSIVNFFTGMPYGLGRHILAVKNQHDLELILKGEFVFTQINTWSVCFVKLTILTFYYKCFPLPNFQRLSIVAIAFVAAWSFSVWGVTLWGCNPIKKWWATDAPGTCINLVPFGILANLVNVLTDFFIFLMPVPVLWKLKVSLAKKLALCGVFSLGLATCVVTVLRMVRIFLIQSSDFTWNNVPISAFYVFEPVGGLLCINIPFVARAIRSKLKSTETRDNSDPSSHSPKQAAPEPVRKRRGSRWLIGIDSIQLTGLSSKRKSLDVERDVDGRPWLQLPATSQDDLARAGAMDEDKIEPCIQKPEPMVVWTEKSLKKLDLDISVPENNLVKKKIEVVDRGGS